MVSQNAKRLEKIVNDILNVSRVQPYDETHLVPALPLAATVHRICSDWATQSSSQRRLSIHPGEGGLCVRFDSEHLRRVLVNLLDNARRYTEDHADTIQVIAEGALVQGTSISVWSAAPPLEQSVERHLFEPFFSSDSRSSGLGLYICRELCERHGASLSYQRSVRTVRGQPLEGNAFVIVLQIAEAPDLGTSTESEYPPTPWQPNLY